MITAESVKAYARQLGADLTGIGSIDRCAHAPLMMSPQGVFPGAQSIVVMAIHHPDACIELGGETHPQEIGPYSVQYLMNSRLDEMAYRMATFLERNGHGAIPIASSNIWRYNQYKTLTAVFAPDISHIYMAVVAGLADLGFNGLALTPQFGARNRFITVITDAVIAPDPLIPPGTVCDRCMLCRKHCPSQALSLEISGEKVIKIGNYEYRFPDKNLWRCAWGEHFDLDLDLDIPAQVAEQVILDNVKQHGIRSGEMGQCLKFCVPKPIRMFDRAYSKTPMRRYALAPDDTVEDPAVTDQLLQPLLDGGADAVIVSSADTLKQHGIDLNARLPGAKTAITLLVVGPAAGNPEEFGFGAQYQVDSLCYDLTRGLENLGFRSLMTVKRSGSRPDPVKDENPTEAILERVGPSRDRKVFANTVITRKTIAPQQRRAVTGGVAMTTGDETPAGLTRHLLAYARELGADLAGVASTDRVDQLVAQLRPLFAHDSLLNATDRSVRFTAYDPQVTEQARRITTAADHLPDAQSVLVFGLRLHQEVLRYATRPPAEAVGPYVYQTYITRWMGATLAYRLVRRLENLGYRAVMTTDLTGTDSVTANPRGPQPDLFCNRFAGVAAGLGPLTVSGHLTTPEFGIRQYLVAIVTNAPLVASPLPPSTGEAPLCLACSKPCVTTCPSQAFDTHRVGLTCAGQTFAFNPKNGKRCDWVKRYALMGESGFQYLGSTLRVPPPADPTREDLADALRLHDPIKKYRPGVAEPCVIHCPLATA
jgi:epoxyqueuosine reductase QueG